MKPQFLNGGLSNMEAAWTYMLRCADGKYYVGTARGSLERRLAEHQAGVNCGFTKRRRPVTLVWSQGFQRITDAIAAERQIKGWSRAKKEALMAGDWASVSRLARNRTEYPATAD